MNKLVTCPYDAVHKVKESRLAMHIAKCRLNHLDEEKVACPFNAKHVIPLKERDYHLINCSDRAPLDKQIFAAALEKNNPFKGNTAVPSYSESAPAIADEVWDDEYYEPTPLNSRAPPPCAIIEPPAMAKPAERRKLYQEMHRYPTEMEELSKKADPAPSKPTVHHHVNRQPIASCQVETKRHQSQISAGYGRGKTMTPPSRIAANIFAPAPPTTTTAPNSAAASNSSGPNSNYSNALTTGMTNLVLGRGYSAISDTNALDEDEFPALSCGRGVYRPNKSGGNRYPGSKSQFST